MDDWEPPGPKPEKPLTAIPHGTLWKRYVRKKDKWFYTVFNWEKSNWGPLKLVDPQPFTRWQTHPKAF